jgi:transposase
MDKGRIIGLKESGQSNREIARTTGHDRKTISKIWNEYQLLSAQLKEPGADVKAIQSKMTEETKYNSTRRRRRKYTESLDARLKEIVEDERKKNRLMGAGHKQKLTNKQIHKKILEEGFEISAVTVNIALAGIRKKQKEVFIRQSYELGDRLEYDFGEVQLDCGEGMKTYHMAVFSSPGASFRWLYLYTNQKKGVFMDSHVRFIEMLGGCHKEIVYDNMKNVVSKFIGKNEKELNPDLVKMSMYYGFRINVTNCFRGNEKGHVENSVKVLRNQLFSDQYRFSSLEEARNYAHSQLIKLNENSRMAEEKNHLLPYKPPLELASISENTVNSSSMVCVDTAFYSVPEHLTGKKVIVKKYHDEIRVFAANELVCTHKRVFGNGNMQVDIYHYLNTLLKKPGAVRNSVALKSIPRLKAIFDTHYSKNPKKFIEIFLENKALSIEEILKLFEEKKKHKAEIHALDVVKPVSDVDVSIRAYMMNYTTLINKGVNQYNEHRNTGKPAEADLYTGQC